MAQKRAYNFDIHAKRLLRMPKRNEPCGLCVAAPNHDPRRKSNERYHGIAQDICTICHHFIGLDTGVFCPYISIGKERALNLSIYALARHFETTRVKILSEINN